MKYYQAVYQTDAHGFNVIYSANIWESEEHAKEYLSELDKIMTKDGEFSYMYDSWVRELFLDMP